MLPFYYVFKYFSNKVLLTKFISACRMVWDLICGTSWFYKSKPEKVTGGGKSAILPNCCCLLSITVLSTAAWYYVFSGHCISVCNNSFWLDYSVWFMICMYVHFRKFLNFFCKVCGCKDILLYWYIPFYVIR